MPLRVASQSLQSQHSLSCNDILIFKHLKGETPCLHFFIGKQYGNAVKRNLLKRRIRYLYHALIKKLDISLLRLSVFPVKKNISYRELKHCFSLLEKGLT